MRDIEVWQNTSYSEPFSSYLTVGKMIVLSRPTLVFPFLKLSRFCRIGQVQKIPVVLQEATSSFLHD